MFTQPPSLLHCVRAAAFALAAAALVAACSEGGDATADATTPGQVLRLVIPDGNIREPDVPCTGARGFGYAHPEAAYVIEDSNGQDVASGVLPEGRAEKAFNIDLGDGRQPTVCVMMLEVSVVASLDGHALVIEGRAPVPIEPNRNLDNMPEAVLR